MTARDIQTLLTAQPFNAFTLRTTRVGAHVVASPADALLTQTTIYLVEGRDGDGIATGVQPIALAQVSSVTVDS